VLQASSDRPGPGEWAELAQQAGAVFDHMRRAERDRAASQRTPSTTGTSPKRWKAREAGRTGPRWTPSRSTPGSSGSTSGTGCPCG
jgi:hypothetical protein